MKPKSGTRLMSTSHGENPPSFSTVATLTTGTHAFQTGSPILRNIAARARANQT